MTVNGQWGDRKKWHFSYGLNKNIKITTLEDIDMFKAMYATKRDAWLKNSTEMK